MENLQIGTVDRDQLPQVCAGQRSIDDVDVLIGGIELLDQPVAHFVRHRSSIINRTTGPKARCAIDSRMMVMRST